MPSQMKMFARNLSYLSSGIKSRPVNCFSSKAITSIYMPCVGQIYSADDIARTFYRSGIARLHKVTVERNGKYNRVYATIDTWLDTEIAYNFIMKLKNSKIETRIIHDQADELWWAVHINKFPHKLLSSGKKNRITTVFSSLAFEHEKIFECNDMYNDNCLENVEPTYQTMLREKYAWVDLLLEKRASEKRKQYEASAFEDNLKPFY
jgi:hypothetical protein